MTHSVNSEVAGLAPWKVWLMPLPFHVTHVDERRAFYVCTGKPVFVIKSVAI
jgi:hypothetical protein